MNAKVCFTINYYYYYYLDIWHQRVSKCNKESEWQEFWNCFFLRRLRCILGNSTKRVSWQKLRKRDSSRHPVRTKTHKGVEVLSPVGVDERSSGWGMLGGSGGQAGGWDQVTAKFWDLLVDIARLNSSIKKVLKQKEGEKKQDVKRSSWSQCAFIIFTLNPEIENSSR